MGMYLDDIGGRDEVVEEFLLELEELFKGEVWRVCLCLWL